jgi:hypothetical protein
MLLRTKGLRIYNVQWLAIRPTGFSIACAMLRHRLLWSDGLSHILSCRVSTPAAEHAR